MTRRITPEKGTFERHAQSIIAAVILAVVIYTGTTMQEIKEQAAKTAVEVSIFQRTVGEKIVSLENQMASLQVAVTKASEDRVKNTDAASAFAARDHRINDLEVRLRNIEIDNANAHRKIK